jgi:cell division septation protein DedD
MRNNETGEFELVVGNRQLLSGFFIVVLLFAVAFAMGYVVGENSHSTKAKTEVAGAATGSTPGETRPQPASAAPANPPGAAPTQPADPVLPHAVDRTPQPTTQPSREVSTPIREVPPPIRDTRPAQVAPAPAAPAEPASGSYWQVAATTNRESAQTLIEALKDKGFPATLSPGPNNYTRVLVGPYSDTAALARAKTDLENAGFNHLVRH